MTLQHYFLSSQDACVNNCDFNRTWCPAFSEMTLSKAFPCLFFMGFFLFCLTCLILHKVGVSYGLSKKTYWPIGYGHPRVSRRRSQPLVSSGRDRSMECVTSGWEFHPARNLKAALGAPGGDDGSCGEGRHCVTAWWIALLGSSREEVEPRANKPTGSESPPRPHMSYGARSWTFNTDAAAAVAVLHPGTGLRLQADSGSSRALHKGSTLIKWHWALLSFFILKGPPCWPISAATADMFRAPLASPAINPPSPAESPGPMERWRMINYSSC